MRADKYAMMWLFYLLQHLLHKIKCWLYSFRLKGTAQQRPPLRKGTESRQGCKSVDTLQPPAQTFLWCRLGAAEGATFSEQMAAVVRGAGAINSAPF